MIKKLTRAVRQPLGCFLGILLGVLLVVAFLFVPDTAKWLGAPFMALPDALGLVDRVQSNEVIRIVAKPTDIVSFDLDKPGAYFIFHSSYYRWLQGPDHFITGPQGFIESEELGMNIHPYYTPLLWGQPAYRFQISEPGQYTLTMERAGSARQKTQYHLGIAPDYITGKENVLTQAFYLQIGFLILLAGGYYYFRVFRWRAIGYRQRSKEQIKKRDEINDFLSEIRNANEKER